MTTISSVLLVDKRIQDHETIVAAVKADGVRSIVFDVGVIEAQVSDATAASSFAYMLNEIATLGAGSFTNIGIVQHNTGAPFHRFFSESQGEVSTVAGVEIADPTLQTWAGFAAFATTLKNTYGVQNVDLMACALYSDPNWKYVIDTLAVQTGVTIRASTDDTGAAALGGDWFLESHTGVNLKDVYFTEAIENFRGVLLFTNKYDYRALHIKSFAPGSAFAWGQQGNGGDASFNITGGSLTSNIIAVYSSSGAFAALSTTGSVTTWGDINSGGNQRINAGGYDTSVATNLTSGVVKVITNWYAMAAIKNNGSCVTWGHSNNGGYSGSVTLSNIVDIYPGIYSFAALNISGGVVTWGNSNNGANSSSVASSINANVVSVNMSNYAGAALKNNGQVITWGDTTYGGNSSSVSSDISSGVVVVYTDNGYTYSALKNNGQVITWGSYGGNSNVAASSINLTSVVSVYTNNSAYAALKQNGSVVTWGLYNSGGFSGSVTNDLSAGIVKVFNLISSSIFAALNTSGRLIVWGDSTRMPSAAIQNELNSGVIDVFTSSGSFAALKSNGKVLTWGNVSNGGNSSSVTNDISANVIAVYSAGGAFAAIRKDGKVIVWGGSASGGSFNIYNGGVLTPVVGGNLNSGITFINNTSFAMAAIQTTATSFDLSASYYTDNDRYDILRNTQNRRLVNLTTLNNNVFTLSSARDIQRFNYTIPSGAGPFRIIIPDFVDSNYSITSTASIPGAPFTSYIIACDESEPVTISGTTYINYGAFVYRRNDDNTFTKMTSATIGGLTYKLYGGDGINSSGIALSYYRFGAFTVPTKSFGDASFNLTAPVSDSSGAFTYTSSNTSVATVTSGGTVTIVGIGSTTITATQAASGSWPSDSITATLVVNKIASTLGALTVPAKFINDTPFTLTAPTSTISSIISPTYTITSTASAIVPPPDIRNISYGATWTETIGEIIGEWNQDYSGYSVSMSANGRTVAIGAIYNDGPNVYNIITDNRGHVRVYDSIGGYWVQRGGDIDGENMDDNSGHSVSLSADGNIVAIGARYNDGTAHNAGHVRVYRSTPGKPEVTLQTDPSFGPLGWTRLGGDIDGEAESDYSGWSVSLSADGTIVAIGANTNNGANNLPDCGHVRVYKYTPVGWTRMGADIDGEAAYDYSGSSVSLSADGTTVAIGAPYNDGNGSNSGHVRVYRYTPNKLVDISNQSDISFGPIGWTRLGQDIDGESPNDQSGEYSISLSANGNTVAIGAHQNDGTSGVATDNRGHVRVYDLSGNTWIKRGQDIDGEATGDYSGYAVSISSDGNIVAIGAPYNDGQDRINYGLDTSRGHVRIYFWNGTLWEQRGQDIDGIIYSTVQCGRSVCLSSDGSIVAMGAPYEASSGDRRGHVRVYQIPTTNALTYSSSNSSVADVCGNLLLIKGVNGTSTITASQTGNTVTGRLDVSGTTYTLQYNPITYTSSNTSVATVSTYGTVTLTGIAGVSTITATQPETLNYASRSVTGTLDVSGIVTVLGALTIPTKMFGDASFNLTAPTTNNPSGAFTYTSSNTSVATVTSGGIVTIIGIGTTTITATQAGSGIYSSASVTGSFVVNFGNTTAISRLPTDGASVIPTPVSNVTTTYGSLWNQLGADIVGGVAGDESGTSVSISADGTIVAVGARSNSTNRGTVRVYRYNNVSWVQIGSDINGEASSDYSGQSVSLSANGRILAIGANMNDGSGNLLPDSGHVRIYEFNGTNWVQRGGDIDGEANGDQSGISVSLSEDGTTVAIGAIMNDGSGNALSNSGHVRVYRYNASKTSPQLTNQNLSTFGPAGWDRLGADIDGEAVNDQSGFSVSLSVDGSIVAIGAIFNDGTSGTVDTSNNRGHVRVYRYNASKTSPQLTDQTLTTFGPAGWDRMGTDIDGEAAADQSGFSVSLSADGTTFAIGSPLFDASGSNSGRVRVFAWNGSSWTQRGQNINGITLNENIGDSVSLSADGSILSVASFMKVVNYNYNSSTNTWSQIGANVTGASSTPSYNITNALSYSPHIYLDATNPSSYNGSTWANLGSLGGNVVMTNMGTFDANDNGGSFNFNGSTNRGEITVSSTTLTSFTYLAVVKTTGSNTGYATIIEFGSDNLLFCTIGNVLYMYNPSMNFGFTLTANVWYVFALTISSGGATTVYVNGVSIYSTTITPISRTNTVYGIGSGIGGNEYWNGKISAIAVFHNRVLTASEIANVSSTFQTYRVSLSSQGNILAIGAREYDGTTGSSTNVGVTRVYRIDTSGNYTYSSNNTAIADVCGNIILPKTIGSTTIGFTQSASGATASRSGTIAFSVSAITPTIGALSMPAKNFGDASFNLTAPTSDSGGAFTYTSSNTAVATVTTGGTVTIVGVGSTTITATQAASADGNYTTGSVTATLVVSASLSNFNVPAKTYGDASFNLVDPDTTDNTVGFTFASSNPSVATLSGESNRTVTIVGAGSTTITATQAATANRGELTISATLVVSQATPIITIAPITKAYGNPSFRPVITSTNTDTSGGLVFTFTSNNIAVVSMLDASLVRINGVGTTTLSIIQAASANFTDASSSVVVTVNKGVSGFSASSFVVSANKTYGDEAFAISTAPISSSTGAITYSSSDENVATITSNGSGNAITLVGQGTVTFTASQEESALYTADTKTSNTLTVARKTAALSRDTPSADTISKTYGDANFTVSATNESNGAFSFSSSHPSFATINASTGEVTIVAVGSTTLTATRAQTAQYNEASISWTLNIARGTTTLTGLSSLTRNVTVAPFSVTATSASDGAVSYALQDPTSTVLTIHPTSGLVTLLSPGSAVIVASQAQGTLYEAPANITATITVTAAATTLQGATITNTQSFTNVDLSGASLANANITNTNFASGRLNNTNFSGATISGANMSSAELSTSSLANATVTNTNFSSGRLNNANLNGASISSSNMTSADLSGATMRGATITGTDFTSAILRRTDLSGANVRSSIFNSADLSGSTLTRLDASGASFVNADMRGSIISNSNFTNSNMTNANISGTNLNGSTIAGANMSSAQLSGSTMASATITGTNFTSAVMRGTDLSGANARSSIFNNADLSGSTLPRMDASGASFINANLRGANLSNADFTNANMTNANISGADITNVSFTTAQKLQLLKNTDNRVRSEIQVTQVAGSALLPVLSTGSAVRDVPNVSNATFKVMLPTTSLVASETITNIELDIANFAHFYFPIGENEYFQIQGVKYYISGLTVRNYATGATVENITYGVKAIRLLAGSLTIIVNSQNTLSSSSFVVPSYKINTDAAFSPTTLPTSNSSAPIVYSSSNTNIATINSSTGVITPVAGACGYVQFTASQVATETHESASITSNELFVNRLIDFTLPGLNQTFTLSTLAAIDASSVGIGSTDATAVFYVRLSDMTNLFRYQIDSFDVNNTDASDIKYYVFHRTMPTELHINPSHAMMNKTESAGMLGSGQGYDADKSLVKHDFIRYIALRLFNTYHGVDLFQNEQELQENITYLGETVQNNINTILSEISTTSANQTMASDASGNKYLTNDASGNTNLSRELMRQITAAEPSRFYNNGDSNSPGIRNMPLHENDSINFKLTITAAPDQNIVTGVTVIPSRTYLIKMILKNTVNTTSNNTNTVVSDSEMYPNSYPYSTSVITYSPTAAESSSVYNVYSPPAPIPSSRFGYNGWYYANTTTWVNLAPAVRDRVKWVVPSNAVGSSTVADLRYIRMNLKVFNKTSLPFLVVTTQAGSTRKYTISAPNSLANGTVYSFFMNFNSYAREPATVGATNAALTYSNVGSGSFANGEVITSIAIETDSNAAAGSIEFTLSSMVVGEASGEKEYGFSANV